MTTSYRPAKAGPESMLARADQLLMVAAGENDARERFRVAYLAALHGAGAASAMSAMSAVRRGRIGNAWVMLARSGSQFVMWAEYFASFSDIRAAVEAGIRCRVTDGKADEFYGRVGAFLYDVEDRLIARTAPGQAA